ncbi:MAG: HNH endonuclease [Desulfobacteraceae bacterium]|nr:HNH endonuclease [Desulfobacteraceae bacterium]MBC2752604.1 HNH endonuclease [Desulfobacteraceae bacterium]
MNQWNIPEWLEQEVRDRDKVCVYCGIEMIETVPRGGSRKNAATWEHIINDQTIITKENIARCCSSCNASKGTKRLSDWIDSSYCKRKGIDQNSVAQVVKVALEKGL